MYNLIIKKPINKTYNLIKKSINHIKQIYNIYSVLTKIVKIDLIEDDSIVLTFKNNVLIHTLGHCIIYSDQENIIKAKKLHLNPTAKINIKNNAENIIKKINDNNCKKLL